MMKSLWHLLDLFIHLIHLSAIIFLLIGWAFEDTRLVHLVLVWLIFLSWFGLGLIFGFGYCLITDVHWKVKDKLGARPNTSLYVKYVIDNIVANNFSENLINKISIYAYFATFVIANGLLIVRLMS